MSVLDAKRHHEDLVEELIAEVEAYNPDLDRDLVRRAFEFAEPATVKARGKPDKQLLGRATFTAVEAHRFLASVLEIRRFKGLPEARGAGGVE